MGEGVGMAAPCSARRASRSRSAVIAMASAAPSNILMLGGTRFIGQYLARQLVEEGHQVTLLTRGKAPIAARIPDDTDESHAAYSDAVQHVAADRKDADAVKNALKGREFNVVYDINGREAEEADLILEALPSLEQYIYCSSAGLYKASHELPHFETDAGDPKSRHKGKLNTEELLEKRGVNWTSIRPVYIYGPLNYNPVEEWFFHRIAAGRPILVPGKGNQVTQLGHVKDLATAFRKVLGNPKAARQAYNISGERFVTFDGLVRLCAEAAGAPEPELVHFDPKAHDLGKAKAFPLRDQHFFTSIAKAQADLDWTPEFDLAAGLRDSYEKDFSKTGGRKKADFSVDDLVLKGAGKQAVPA
ncbi:CSP41B [Auxenochlorella protothecoides x Auxenochlorella symbiontica]